MQNERVVSFCVTLCVTRMDKNGPIRDYAWGTQQSVNDFKYSKLNAPDVVRQLLQKCRFVLRKPVFYPLNYGNNDRERID